MFQERLKQTLWQVPALVIMAGLIALGINQWRTDGIALIGNWSVEARFSDTAGESLVIPIDQAGALFEQDAAVFLDARPQGQFMGGHIRGALNLPWQEVDRYFMEMADRLDGAGMIITYCDGESCELSHELALFLKEMGYSNVHILFNGWTVWQQAGLPIEGGLK